MKGKTLFIFKAALTLFALGLVTQAYLWPRFRDVKVYDSAADFNANHHVETYWDDDLDREVPISWYRGDLSESFMMQAASWEALDRDEREEIFVNSSREACAA